MPVKFLEDAVAYLEAAMGLQFPDKPFPWQCRLLNQLQLGELPDVCDIPTGLGKTSIIHLWWVALMGQLSGLTDSRLPMRLVYIVDRRVVVDQATEEVVQLEAMLRSVMQTPTHPLHAKLLRAAARLGLGPGDVPLRISTLRGQKADNQAWLQNPTVPTVIVGTVDMIGSRLLFSPYGRVGKARRSMHAGLMAQDSWIVVDEAHLCPSFIQTLRSIRDFVNARPLAPFAVTELSATQLSQSKPVKVFKLEETHGDFSDT